MTAISEWLTMDNKLPLEKQFTLQTFYSQVDKMSREQAQEALKALFEQHLIAHEQYKELLKKEWGL